MRAKEHNSILLYTDGGSRGNPGPAAISFLIFSDDSTPLAKHKEYIGKSTNNEAEYRALIKGLETARKYTRGTVHCFSDSEIVIKQIRKEYKIIKPHLEKLFRKVKIAEKPFKSVYFNNVKRMDPNIQMADRMVNEVLDEQTKRNKRI